ncbi:hypothetical protein GOV09_03670 [Candidatus Woesearchaeota archaeon]|nr:hypothetical protein [Candidatus Woesearchaeota archaeon]
MFGFLKKLFKKEEEIIEKIKAEELGIWFEHKAEQIERNSTQLLDTFRKQLSNKMVQVRELLKNLEKASLRNSNITIREKQFMEGNRKSYVQRTLLYLKEIDDMLEEELHFFLYHYPQYLENFSKSTQRSYRILQEFFSNETREIALKIKELDDVVGDIQKDEEMHNYSKIEKIKKGLEKVVQMVQKEKELEEELKKAKREVSTIEQDKKTLADTKKSLEESKEFKEYTKLEQDIGHAEEKIKKLKQDIYDLFSPITRALRKYQRIALEHEKKIEHYCQDAWDALLKDEATDILHIAKGLSTNIKNGSLVLKNKDKILACIDKMDKKFFSDMKKQHADHIKNKEDIHKKLKEHTTKKEFDKVAKKIEDRKSKISMTKEMLERLTEELNSIDLVHMRDELKKDIEHLLKVKIEFM